MEDRLLDGESRPEEEAGADAALRPGSLAEFIGQAPLKERLEIAVGAARRRGEALDHVLLFGPPGLGKTTLAHILARELDVQIKVTSGPAVERPGDLAAILTNLAPGDVLFIDEIHRLSHAVEEVLYPAMEEFAIDIVLGKGPSAKTLRLELPRFTLVGATTRAGALTGPLRDRFGIIERLEFYSEADLHAIVTRAAAVLGVSLQPAGAGEIARRGRGTARVANRLLRRLRDFAQMKADGVIDGEVAARGCRMHDVDDCGLDASDRRLLRLMAEHYHGGPVGLGTLAAALGEAEETIEDVMEPYLLQRGFLERTPRGRLLGPRAWGHLGLAPPQPPLPGEEGQGEGPKPVTLL